VRRTSLVLLTSFLSLVSIAAGADTPSDTGAAPEKSQTTPRRADPGSEETSGIVTETLGTHEYTYVEVDLGDQRIWAAGPYTPVEVGDTVFLPPGILMVDFVSRHIDRSFDRIYLVHSMRVESSGRAGPTGPPDDAVE
jgi:hypothetical protein